MNTPPVVIVLLMSGIVVFPNLGLLILQLDASAGRVRWASLRVQTACAVLAVASLLPSPGLAAASLTAPWLLAAFALFVALLVPTLETVPHVLWVSIVRLVAAGYLVVSAGFLLAWRAGANPSGLPDAIVALTAVHYLFAGFATLSLATRSLLATEPNTRARIVATAASLLIVVGSPLIALGFVIDLRFLAIGAVVLTCGLISMAAVTAFAVVPTFSVPLARRLLQISSFSVLISMALALDYGIGQVVAIPILTIDQMAWTHGMINAVLFAGCGLAGWVVADGRTRGMD